MGIRWCTNYWLPGTISERPPDVQGVSRLTQFMLDMVMADVSFSQHLFLLLLLSNSRHEGEQKEHDVRCGPLGHWQFLIRT
jgi:hypothetical protein